MAFKLGYGNAKTVGFFNNAVSGNTALDLKAVLSTDDRKKILLPTVFSGTTEITNDIALAWKDGQNVYDEDLSLPFQLRPAVLTVTTSISSLTSSTLILANAASLDIGDEIYRIPVDGSTLNKGDLVGGIDILIGTISGIDLSTNTITITGNPSTAVSFNANGNKIFKIKKVKYYNGDFGIRGLMFFYFGISPEKAIGTPDSNVDIFQANSGNNANAIAANKADRNLGNLQNVAINESLIPAVNANGAAFPAGTGVDIGGPSNYYKIIYARFIKLLGIGTDNITFEGDLIPSNLSTAIGSFAKKIFNIITQTIEANGVLADTINPLSGTEVSFGSNPVNGVAYPVYSVGLGAYGDNYAVNVAFLYRYGLPFKSGYYLNGAVGSSFWKNAVSPGVAGITAQAGGGLAYVSYATMFAAGGSECTTKISGYMGANNSTLHITGFIAFARVGSDIGRITITIPTNYGSYPTPYNNHLTGSYAANAGDLAAFEPFNGDVICYSQLNSNGTLVVTIGRTVADSDGPADTANDLATTGGSLYVYFNGTITFP